MEQNNQVQELLQKLEENSRKQARYARLQCLFSLAAAVCCGGLLILVLGVLPQIRQVVETTEVVAQEVYSLSAQAERVLENLEVTTEQLAQADWASMVANVDDLVVTSEQGVTEALEKLEAIDIETLNKAIANLSAVVEPMAKFFNVFH